MEAKEITSELVLKGKKWDDLINNLVGKVFDTIYQVFVLCASIGIMQDERREVQVTPEEKDYVRTIARTVLINKLEEVDFLFTTAIISTQTENFPVDERLRLAFSTEDTSFKKIKFLEEFANYGLDVLSQVVSSNDLEMMQNIKELFEELMKHDILDEIEIDTHMLY